MRRLEGTSADYKASKKHKYNKKEYKYLKN
jgi:hypothetical protein